MKQFLNRRLLIGKDDGYINAFPDNDGAIQSIDVQTKTVELWYDDNNIIVVVRNAKKIRIYREEFPITEKQKEFFSINDIPIEIKITKVDEENEVDKCVFESIEQMCQVKYPGCEIIKDQHHSWSEHREYVNILYDQNKERIYFYHCSDCGIVEGFASKRHFSTSGRGCFSGGAGFEYHCRICDNYLGREYTKRS